MRRQNLLEGEPTWPQRISSRIYDSFSEVVRTVDSRWREFRLHGKLKLTLD